MPRGWRWRRARRGALGRVPIPVRIGFVPPFERFVPVPMKNPVPIQIEPPEFEVLRLIDFEELTQEEAGERMGVSRGTAWRLLQSARKKVIQALVEGRELIIQKSPINP